MSKRLNIILTDPYFDPDLSITKYPILFQSECSNILKQFEGKKLSREDCTKAVDTLIAYYYQEEIHRMEIDIAERDQSLAPAKEMTLEEIEKKLGYKVKIVLDKEK